VSEVSIAENKKGFKHRRGAERAKQTYCDERALSKQILVTAIAVLSVKRRATVVLSLLKP